MVPEPLEPENTTSMSSLFGENADLSFLNDNLANSFYPNYDNLDAKLNPSKAQLDEVEEIKLTQRIL